MKKFYFILFVAVFFTAITKAGIVVINVTNFQFTPANVNVNVGDVVRFQFVAGFHNATTNNVPAGLPAGAAALYSGNPGSTGSYDYSVTKAGTYKYVCEVHGDAASYTGMVGQFVASAALPVTLKDFFIIPNIDKKPLLTWSTSTEINSRYFSIRSSTDGVNFKETGRVNASGNSTIEKAYSYIDNTISKQYKFIYYELVIIDNDGKEKLSEIKIFKNTLAVPQLIYKITPTIITRPGQLMVYYNADKAGKLKVKVFDAAGKMVFNTNMEAFPGINSGHIHVCDFEAGSYLLQFSLDGLKETKRIIVN